MAEIEPPKSWADLETERWEKTHAVNLEQVRLMERDIESREATVAQQDMNVRRSIRTNALIMALRVKEKKIDTRVWDNYALEELADYFVEYIERED